MLLHLAGHPEESALIDRIVAGYGDLEYLLSHCLSTALGHRPSVFRAFFRMRGEQQRLEVADALIRHHYEEIGLKDEYTEAPGAMRWCRTVRNQYAHCHWAVNKEGRILFTNMEYPAKKATGEITFRMYPVDKTLLFSQENYCYYTLAWLYFLEHELKKLRGTIPSHDAAKPQIIVQPQLYNLP